MGRLGITLAMISLCAALGSAAFVFAQPVLDDESGKAAEKLAADRFSDGEHAFARGDYAKAGAAFEAAYQAKPHEAALWNAARSWERAGELAHAANLYRLYLRTAPDDAVDRKHALTALEGLTPKLGRIEILAEGVSGVEVDGHAVIDSVVFVNPGTHLVSGKTADDTPLHKETTLAAGAVQSVLLGAPPSAPSAIASPPPSASIPPVATAAPTAPLAPKTPPEAKSTHHGTSPWLLAPFIGTTSISGILLIASGIDVLRARSDYDDLKKGRSPDEQQQLIQEGVGKTDRTNVLIGVTAGLAIVTGVVALTAIDWAPREKSPDKTPTKTSGFATGRVSLGPQGATLEASF